MELSKYEAFLKTVELGNITQAADVLGYTQPAVSRVIADLEREWGVPLLIRNRTGVSLTPEGEYLIPQIRAVCAAQRELEGSVERLLSLDGGTVRVGSFHSVAANWLPQIVRSFLQIYPNVDIQISYNLEYSAIENSIIQGGVDCGFVTLPLNVRSTPPLHTFFLKREQICAVLPPDHLLARAKSYPVTRFSEDPFIPIREDQDRDMSRIFKSCGVRPNIRYFAEDSNIIASMIECGLGVGIMSELILNRMPYHIVHMPLDPPQYRDIALAVRSNGIPSPAVSRFLEHVQNWVAEHT